ncbi:MULTISPECIES: ATP-binding sensor histidine kinase [unclassified Moorena]|uniref:ATP-binding sensor histidine kinase n=1 Tax=unclassified Moorena TaxID=2683338 RepID=UPI0025800A3B|nr:MULTISPECIES: ATP-binding sensor histidine kinase [unclassified Moorena]
MMLQFPNYQIKLLEELEAGVSTVVYRGYHQQQQRPVIIKLIKSDYPSLKEISSLRQEYTISQAIDCEGIVKCYGLENDNNGLALIFEDFGGQSLKHLINSHTMTIKDFLRIAISLVETLDELHKVPIIHKDINPSNIIINPETGQVKITDLGIASRLSLENPTTSNPNWLEGTLAYISPEQTGRMNRSIDYRSDFYSLGATFYEMLTDRVPFITTDPMELIHHHLAQYPVPPHQLNPEISEVVSLIVMKLLRKNAEDRYQSAAGLKVDLETCLSQLQTTGKIETFTPGTYDIGSRLLIPQKLYGREGEVATLMEAFERVSVGATELMLVSGYSGIGKTSVVNEVHKPIVKARGYFISGKFDQFKRNSPYAALLEAFRGLIRQLLTEPAQTLGIWKQNLLHALGANGKVIIDVIPEVELIIGEQPEVPQLGASESQNRFLRVFQQFIGVFAQPQHPLVLFLDDLQWADLASLTLLQTLMTNCDRNYLLIIGAYRDNEVSPTHPLIQTIEKIQETDSVIDQIKIEPLRKQYVQQLVADTLNDTQGKNQTKPLAELLFHKTQGNPFFLTQLLKTLYSENLLSYDVTSGSWQWDIDQIQAIGITDYNVVELIARSIGKLQETTQQVLKLAACLGNQFNLEMLAIVNEDSTIITATQLWEALQIGLILPLSDSYKIPLLFEQEESADFGLSDVKVNYKFLHDRVQQAAYSLIPESDQQATHLKIGKLLLNHTTPEAREENIFALVNQLNFGTDLLTAQWEKDELAQLNLIAGQKAKAAAAYASALKYLNVGLGLLPADTWTDNYDFTLALYLEVVEAEYLNSNFDQSNLLARVALEQAKTQLDQVKVYELKIHGYIAQNQMQVALDTGLQVLDMLGIPLEQDPPKDLISEDLADLPEMTDLTKLAAMGILKSVGTPAFVANPALYPLLIFTQINLCINHGNSHLSTNTYISYAMILCGFMGDIDGGYTFGQLSLMLLEQLDAEEFKSIVLDLFNGHIRHWKEHLKETLNPLLEAFNSGLETGELTYSGFAALNYCTNLLFVGDDLDLAAQKYGQYLEWLQKRKLDYHVIYGQIGKQLTLNLLGKSDDPCQLIGEDFNELEMLPILREQNNGTSLFYLYLAKSILFYWFKQPEQAIAQARAAEQYAQSVAGLILVAEHNFYYSLALLAHYPHVEPQQQGEYLTQVAANQETLKTWAYHAPSNFKHKYELVEAEKARVLGQHWQAMERYDQGIEGAADQDYIQEEALANELAAEFYLSCGKRKIAQAYLTDAYYGYSRWGALAKVRDLESRYPQLLSKITAQPTTKVPLDSITNSTIAVSLNALDLSDVIKASQAISEEIVFENLLDKLMQILLTNAGAKKGFIILSKDDKLIIEAAGTVVNNGVTFRESIPVTITQHLPISVINYVAINKENLLLNNLVNNSTFADDIYIINNQPKSAVCLPLLRKNNLIGMVYLENNMVSGNFTNEHLEVLSLLCNQAAISLENATLYQTLHEVQVRERLEKQIRKSLEREKELTELKSRFISMTSHEFRTPLTTIMGVTEIFKYYSQNWTDEKKQNYLDRIQVNVKHMLHMLDDVLVVNKANAGKLKFNPAPLNLLEFCRDLVEDIELGIDTQQSIVFSIQCECPEVNFDEKLLRHILINLLSNATKYSPNDSTINFDLICQQEEVIFKIKDQGIGIPEEDQKQLFESFHRCNNVGNIPGTGLGLAIVKQSVEVHGGEITVNSQVGIGTTFTVTIPLYSPAVPEQVQRPRAVCQLAVGS